MINPAALRRTILQMIHSAGSGHPGGSLSLVEILTFLYRDFMNVRPEEPDWPDRDRLVLSKGHGAPALYAVLAAAGFFPEEKLNHLRSFGSGLEGHPHMQSLPGLDCSTGSLGQGLGIAAGMALGLRMQNRPSRVFCILGDGELQEGSVWESAMSAASQKLSNLFAIVDCNRVQLDDSVVNVMPVEPIAGKWKAFGWTVALCDGHSIESVEKAFDIDHAGPLAVIAHTVKGKGVSFMENRALWHGRAPDSDELQKALEELS
ncbi:transketolase [Candidatus Fermentibacteria bacterium]|nr:MAG: transketolase [Candidatus Fermentibacteria bacterium]